MPTYKKRNSNPRPPHLVASSGYFLTSVPLPQVLGTADRFFSSASRLWLLKLPYARLDKEIQWDDLPSGGGCFPHLYGRNFGVADVEDARGFVKEDGQVWSEVLKGDAWLA